MGGLLLLEGPWRQIRLGIDNVVMEGAHPEAVRNIKAFEYRGVISGVPFFKGNQG